jgi:hypothetical protein
MNLYHLKHIFVKLKKNAFCIEICALVTTDNVNIFKKIDFVYIFMYIKNIVGKVRLNGY